MVLAHRERIEGRRMLPSRISSSQSVERSSSRDRYRGGRSSRCTRSLRRSQSSRQKTASKTADLTGSKTPTSAIQERGVDDGLRQTEDRVRVRWLRLLVIVAGFTVLVVYAAGGADSLSRQDCARRISGQQNDVVRQRDTIESETLIALGQGGAPTALPRRFPGSSQRRTRRSRRSRTCKTGSTRSAERLRSPVPPA